MKRVLVTGAKGTIGNILTKGLQSHYQLTLIDKIESNEENYFKLDVTELFDDFKELLQSHDSLIHLAWDRSIIRSKKMILNVYEAALGVEPHPRVIMASSIHAAGVDWSRKPYSLIADRKFDDVREISLIGVDKRMPDSAYGEAKLWMEDLGRCYSKRGLEVICIRFGGVNQEDTPLTNEKGYHSIWLSHRDCVQMIKRCIEAKNLPSFTIFYGVSNNKHGVYNISNARKILNYKPLDNSIRFLET